MGIFQPLAILDSRNTDTIDLVLLWRIYMIDHLTLTPDEVPSQLRAPCSFVIAAVLLISSGYVTYARRPQIRSLVRVDPTPLNASTESLHLSCVAHALAFDSSAKQLVVQASCMPDLISKQYS